MTRSQCFKVVISLKHYCWVQIPELMLIRGVDWIFIALFFFFNGNKIVISYLLEWFWVNEITQVKYLGQCLPYYIYLINNNNNFKIQQMVSQISSSFYLFNDLQNMLFKKCWTGNNFLNKWIWREADFH